MTTHENLQLIDSKLASRFAQDGTKACLEAIFELNKTIWYRARRVRREINVFVETFETRRKDRDLQAIHLTDQNVIGAMNLIGILTQDTESNSKNNPFHCVSTQTVEPISLLDRMKQLRSTSENERSTLISDMKARQLQEADQFVEMMRQERLSFDQSLLEQRQKLLVSIEQLQQSIKLPPASLSPPSLPNAASPSPSSSDFPMTPSNLPSSSSESSFPSSSSILSSSSSSSSTISSSTISSSSISSSTIPTDTTSTSLQSDPVASSDPSESMPQLVEVVSSFTTNTPSTPTLTPSNPSPIQSSNPNANPNANAKPDVWSMISSIFN